MSKVHGNYQFNAANQIGSYYADTGVADHYAVSMHPKILSYTLGLGVRFIASNSNTGPCFLSVEGLGDVPIKKDVTADLNPNDILAGKIIDVIYDGTNFQWLGSKFAPVQNGVIFGGQVTWQGGYTFRVSAAGYYINFQYFTSPTTDITLNPPDATFDRFDTFVLDTTGSALPVEGTPSATPTEPPLDLGTQLRVGATLVEVGTTAPDITMECIYLENTEWTTGGVNGGRINAGSLNSPRTGIRDIEASGTINADYISFTRSTPFIPVTDFGYLRFYIKAKVGWDSIRKIVLQWYNGGVPVGSGVTVQPGSLGFVGADTVTYQQIAIPLSSFGLITSSTVDSFRITTVAINPLAGYFIDDICLLAGDINPVQNLPSFQNALTYSPVANTVELGGFLLHSTLVQTLSYVMTLQGYTIYDYPYKFDHPVTFENGTGILSFHNGGSQDVTALDFQHQVTLAINYTSNKYSTTSGPLPGYLNTSNIGYWLGVNGTGNGASGIGVENSNSKVGGVFFHTLDGTLNTNMVTIFGKQPPTTSGQINFLSGATAFQPYLIASFKTTGALQFYKYGIGTFTAAETFLLGVDAVGNVVEVNPAGLGGGGGASRFGVTGEDDTATQNRNFKLGLTHLFDISDAGGTHSFLKIDPINGFYRIGDMGLISGGAHLNISDHAHIIEFNSNNKNYLRINSNTNDHIFGDNNGSGDQRLEILGSTNQVHLQGRVVTIGDTDGAYNANTLSINSPAGTAFFKIAGYLGATVGDVLTITDITTGAVSWSTPATSLRFGVAGEDDIQGESRTFHTDGYTFNMTNTTTLDAVLHLEKVGIGGQVLEVVSDSDRGIIVSAVNTAIEASVNGNGGVAGTFSYSSFSTSNGLAIALGLSTPDNNSVLPVMRIERFHISNSPSAGIGGSIIFDIQANAATFPTSTNEIASKWTNTDWAGSQAVSQLYFTGVYNNISSTIMTVDGSGVVGIGIDSAFGASRLHLEATTGVAQYISNSEGDGLSISISKSANFAGANAIFASSTYTGTSGSAVGLNLLCDIQGATAANAYPLTINTLGLTANDGFSIINKSDNDTSSISEVFRFIKGCYGAPGNNGNGVSISFFIAASDSNSYNTNSIESYWTDSDIAHAGSALRFKGYNGGSTMMELRSKAGSTEFNIAGVLDYTSGVLNLMGGLISLSGPAIFLAGLSDAPDDVTAAGLGVQIGQIYTNGSQLMIRQS